MKAAVLRRPGDVAGSPLEMEEVAAPQPGAGEVLLRVRACGVCRTDLHIVEGELAPRRPLMIPGHQIVGDVVAPAPAGLAESARVGVGWLGGTDGACWYCRHSMENLCDAPTFTGYDVNGGYAEYAVARADFVYPLPEGLSDLDAAPLLCAGITLYSPLKHWGAGPGKKVGIIGLGGLGHMGVKLAHALGAHTVLFTTSPGKVTDGKRLGADEVIISKDPEQMKPHGGSFDLIIDTVSASHDLSPYFMLLKRDATMVQVGAPEHPLPIAVFPLIMKRLNFSGSAIGGIAETQEMLDFCAAKNITADVEIIPIQKINEAYERMLKSDVKYRFSIDMASLKA